MRTGTRRRWWGLMFTILLPLWLVGATAGPGQAPPPARTRPAGAQAPLLQFRSQGHVLGFADDRMYTVGMGGALIEEFVGARTVRPPPRSPQTRKAPPRCRPSPIPTCGTASPAPIRPAPRASR